MKVSNMYVNYLEAQRDEMMKLIKIFLLNNRRCKICGRFARIIDGAKVNCTKCGYGAPNRFPNLSD